MRFTGIRETPRAKLARQIVDANSQRNLQAGGLTVAANKRLELQSHDPHHRWTSDLSVNELLLTRKLGYEPVGQVMGSSIYHVGWQYTPMYSSGELAVLTHAHWQARMLALSRLQQEARLLKAHGVVGVRLTRNEYSWGRHLIEFSVMGTAIKLSGEPAVEHPFLSDLSGQEFWQLRQVGFFPVGFAYGNCAWYEAAGFSTMAATVGVRSEWFGYGNTKWQNQELTDFTKGMYTARHMSMTRLTQECERMGASGVIGVEIQTQFHTKEREINEQKRVDLVIQFSAIGTAIVEADIDTAPRIDYGTLLSDPVQAAY